MRRIVLSLVICFAMFARASEVLPASIPDTSWVRDFASPVSEKGRENQLNWDPRFRALLQSSLPQHQFFWRDHGRFTLLPALVQTFIGVPGSVLLEHDRYVTIDGCVPHDCGDRGLVWIDTVPSKHSPVIFVATSNINNGPSETGSPIHLWLFSSTTLDWQKMPPQFLSSLSEWWNSTTKAWAKLVPERIVLITIVQPSGEMVDLSPSMFAFTVGAKK